MRRAEQLALKRLLDGARNGSGGAMTLLGPPGAGVSSLLDHAAAEATGFTVLRAGAAAPEAGLRFAGLHALLRPVMDRLPRLPPPQAAALATALTSGLEGDGIIVPAAVLNLLSATARERPVLACVDDVHHLDPPSREALLFAARRLGGEAVALLFGGHGADVPAIPELRLAALSGEEASHELLDDLVTGPVTGPETGPAIRPVAGSARAGTSALADDMRGPLIQIAGGNPLALIELTASLTARQRSGEAPPPETLPQGGRLWRAHRQRLAPLPARTRRVLLLIAADPEMEADTLMRAVEPEDALAALEPAEAAGITRVTGRAIGFHEPLIGPVIYQEASLAQRRAAHRRLAAVLSGCAAPGTGRRRSTGRARRSPTSWTPPPPRPATTAATSNRPSPSSAPPS